MTPLFKRGWLTSRFVLGPVWLGMIISGLLPMSAGAECPVPGDPTAHPRGRYRAFSQGESRCQEVVGSPYFWFTFASIYDCLITYLNPPYFVEELTCHPTMANSWLIDLNIDNSIGIEYASSQQGPDDDKPKACGIGNPIDPGHAIKFNTEIDYMGSGPSRLEFTRVYRGKSLRAQFSIGRQ